LDKLKSRKKSIGILNKNIEIMKALTEGKDSLVSLSSSEINKKGISLVQRPFP